MSITEYINLHFNGNQSEFARRMEVNRQQVTRWISEDWIVVGHILYSPRRSVPENGA